MELILTSDLQSSLVLPRIQARCVDLASSYIELEEAHIDKILKAQEGK